LAVFAHNVYITCDGVGRDGLYFEGYGFVELAVFGVWGKVFKVGNFFPVLVVLGGNFAAY
jgi:hypothetical protein